jgi:hypothetical protein
VVLAPGLRRPAPVAGSGPRPAVDPAPRPPRRRLVAAYVVVTVALHLAPTQCSPTATSSRSRRCSSSSSPPVPVWARRSGWDGDRASPLGGGLAHAVTSAAECSSRTSSCWFRCCSSSPSQVPTFAGTAAAPASCGGARWSASGSGRSRCTSCTRRCCTSTTPGGWPSPAVTSSPQLVPRLPGGVRRGRGRAAHRVRATDRAVDPTAGTRPVIRRACGPGSGPGAGAGTGTARQGRHRVLVRPDGGSVLTGGD